MFPGGYSPVSTIAKMFGGDSLNPNRGPAPLPPRPCLPVAADGEQLYNDDPKMGKLLKYQIYSNIPSHQPVHFFCTNDFSRSGH